MNLAILISILLSNMGFCYVVFTAFDFVPTVGKASHVMLAMPVTLIVLFSHSLIMFYLIGTGKMVKEILAETKDQGIDEQYYRKQLLSFKHRGFPLPTYAILVVMVTFIVGAGVHTGVIPKMVHSSLAVFALILNLVASIREVLVLIDNGLLIFRLNEQIQATQMGEE